ncbi:MAG: YIP1 family protein [Clostridiaceae bacterium]|nr:YIP1 family protein [Clostridiaceae bacterium]
MESKESTIKKTLLQKLKLFFVKPSELFRDYLEKPTWALKLLIISLVSGIYTYGTKILGKDLIAEMMEEKAAAMSPEQAEAVRASIPFLNSPKMNIISAAIGAVSIIVIILVVSLVYMAFVRVLKGKINYKQMLSIYTLAYMAAAIGMVVKLAFMYFTGNLLYLEMTPTFTNTLYNNLDPFIIWQAILMVFGISVVSGISEKKSTIIVVGMWLVTLAISFGSMMLTK